MQNLPVYVKEQLPFAQDLPLENSVDSYLCFRLALFHSVSSTPFSSIDYLLCHYAWFLILFHLTQMRFSRSTHLLMCLSFKTLTAIIRTDLPILVELIDLVNSYNFSSQMTLLRWLTFVLGSLTVTITVLLFWIYLVLLMLAFVLQRLSLHWEILIILLSKFPLIFQ